MTERNPVKEKEAALGSQVLPEKKVKSVSEQKRDRRRELLRISVHLDTGKLLGIALGGLITAFLLITGLVFLVN